MKIRKLISLHPRDGKWFISFSYYIDNYNGNIKYTGESESGYLSEEELYELLKPKLRKEMDK